MSVDSNDLTIPDVFDDITKNLCNLSIDSEESCDVPNVIDSLYYTEEDFVNLINESENRRFKVQDYHYQQESRKGAY